MLAIRLQRVGRTGYATYRLAVQEAHRQPTSGRVVAYVGIYNPHTKEAKVQVELAQKYLDNGAQPSPRVVKLLKDAGVKMPDWVQKPNKKTKETRNADKLRKNRPKIEQPTVEETVEEPMVELEVEEAADAESVPTEDSETADQVADEAPAKAATAKDVSSVK